MKRAALFLLALCLAIPAAARAEEEVKLRFSRQELEAKWRERIQTLLAKGVIPVIDMESSFPNGSEPYVDEALRVMDEVGVALIAFDGQQAPPDGVTKGYRWGYRVHRLVNAHPDRFIVATNGGTNANWTSGRGGDPTDFIDQLEQHVRRGDYPLIGEVEF
ncbi:MAG: hypothetical protein WEC33_02305, partial [Dehalococcoidia bacterium]